MACQRALRLQGIDYLLEGDVVLGVGIEIKGANPSQQLPEAGIPGYIGA
jgi:hypothetical protein